MPTLLGYQLRSSPYVPEQVPKLEIDPNFEWITPACRHKINEFLAGAFGHKMPFYIIGGHTLIAHPLNIRKLEIELRAQNFHGGQPQ